MRKRTRVSRLYFESIFLSVSRTNEIEHVKKRLKNKDGRVLETRVQHRVEYMTSSSHLDYFRFRRLRDVSGTTLFYISPFGLTGENGRPV